MTNEQPKPLRLADELHQKHNGEGLLAYCEAELRRLHAENEGKAERIQDIYKQLDATEKEVDDLRLLLRQVYKAMGLIVADLVCEAAHHNKEDRHAIGEPCPIQKRWHETFAAIKERLK